MVGNDASLHVPKSYSTIFVSIYVDAEETFAADVSHASTVLEQGEVAVKHFMRGDE